MNLFQLGSNLQESEDESSMASIWATCSEIWLPALANNAPQATGRQLGSSLAQE